VHTTLLCCAAHYFMRRVGNVNQAFCLGAMVWYAKSVTTVQRHSLTLNPNA